MSLSILFVRCFTAAALMAMIVGCDSTSPDSLTPAVKTVTIDTDISRLKKLIRLPDSASRVAWQSGEQSFSTDWWLAAHIEFLPNQMPSTMLAPVTKKSIALPAGFNFAPPFDQLMRVGVTRESPFDSFVADTVSIEPFAKSPLLDGISIPIDKNSLFVLLLTK